MNMVMTKITKQEVEDILSTSKEENKKYLYKMLSIKNISAFDISYIMSKIKLNDKKIKLLEYSISQYSKNDYIKSNESINEYIFEITKNIEKMEKSNDELIGELMDCKNEIESFKKILSYIIEKNITLLMPKNDYSKQNFVFSTIYIDK